MKQKIKKTLLLGLGIMAFSQSPLLRAEEDKDEVMEEREGEHEKSSSENIEGAVIKIKLKNNEIYVRTKDGKREEVYLDAKAQVFDGAKEIKLSDLKKDMKVRVSGKSKVEVIK